MQNELTLREIQLNSLNVLKKIKKICEKENITYFLGYGTLLGAIRHQGFIPWDDDIDIMMPREDYEKFIEYCIINEKELEYFSLKHYLTSKEYIYPIARFCDTRYRIEYENAKEYGLGLFVDIYPLDGIDLNDKRFIQQLQWKQKLINLCGTTEYVASEIKIKNFMKYPLFLVSRLLKINKLLQDIDSKSKKYDYNVSEDVECVNWGMKYYKTPKKLFEKIKLQKFEDDYFNIPEGYDEILKAYYNNYMELPPIEKQKPQHFYKAYKK